MRKTNEILLKKEEEKTPKKTTADNCRLKYLLINQTKTFQHYYDDL